MNRLLRNLAFFAVASSLALVLPPPDSEAELLTLLASNIFSTDGTQSNGLAYDLGSTTEHLYIADSAAQLRVYTLDGSLVAGPLALPGTGSPTELGLHFLRADTSLAGGTVPAGTRRDTSTTRRT